MRFHEVLGIKEIATIEDIEHAYMAKTHVLESSKDVLGFSSFSKKHKELEDAKKDCIAWAEMSSVSKLKARTAEYSGSSSKDVRLNEVCFGPCTCADACGGTCCGEGLCGSMGSADSFCVECCGSGGIAIPIICDLLIYAYGAWSAYSAHKDSQKKQEQEYRRQQAERAQNENAHLQENLTRCLQEQLTIQTQLRYEERLNNFVSAHVAMFSNFEIVGLDSILNNQEKQLVAKKQEYDAKAKVERDLRSKIDRNQSIINAAQS